MTATPAVRPPIYLCAPINALVEGVYEERFPLQTLLEYGDFGIGTFDQLDGEMVILEGDIYQVTNDGIVKQVSDEGATPFAGVTFFNAHTTDHLSGAESYEEFQQQMEGLLFSKNICYAIRIDGYFKHVKVRSVPKQENYRPLVEVAKEQAVFEFENISGTLLGFYTPSFMASVNVPGLHLHFLSDDRQHGGHLLSCIPGEVTVGLQFVDKIELSLPLTFDYLTMDFERDIAADLDEAEK